MLNIITCHFLQIQQISKGVKEMHSLRQLAFLDRFRFDPEEASNIAIWFGTCIVDELKQYLESTKKAFTIDNSTLSTTTISALKASYS